MKITFGKYKNQEISKIYHDKFYKNWLLNQQFFKDKYSKEYNYLKNYKPIKSINFTDLPCDIKSMIYKINYDRDPKKLQYESDKRKGIVKNGKGRKQIITELIGGRWGSAGTPITTTRYLNCKECGRGLYRNGGGYHNQQGYEYCGNCYDKFHKMREDRKKLFDNFCLIDTDSDDE